MSQIVAVAQSGLKAFFEWWWNELEGLLPRAWNPSRRQRRRLLVLVLGADGAALFQGSGASRRLIARSEGVDPDTLKAAIGKAHGRRRQTIVRLPPQRGLRKTLELPVAPPQVRGPSRARATRDRWNEAEVPKGAEELSALTLRGRKAP
jgi:hypothetical protein